VKRKAAKQTAALIAGAFCVTAGAAWAGDYPNRPIRMIAPFPAGGGADIYGRILAKKMSDVLKQQVIVDNRSGANGLIGTELVARAAPDGYTIMFTTSSHALNPAMRHKLPYDSVKDFAPIALFTEFPFFVVSSPSFPPKSIPELLALARAKPGYFNYASISTGSAQHFAGEMLNAYANINIVRVGYRGVPAALTEVFAGAVGFTFLGPTIMPTVKAGKLRALAVTTARRSAVWLDIPTVQEGGVPNYHFTQWNGLFAPRDVPQPVLARLHQALVQTLKDREVNKTLSADGADLGGNTPGQFRDFLLREISKYQELARGKVDFIVD
jgi:tripartite-type tricarboxylate transporter receptor subunit TctC